MSSKAADAKVISASSKTETVIGFEPVRLSAPFFLRCGALLIDYIIFLIVPVAFMLFSRYLGNDGARLVAGSLNDTGWLVAILVTATNFLVFPAFSGQTIGKMLTGLKVVRTDGHQASIGRMLIRQTFGYGLTLASLGIGFLFSVFSSKGRTLHDYLCGTVVVYADKRYR